MQVNGTQSEQFFFRQQCWNCNRSNPCDRKNYWRIGSTAFTAGSAHLLPKTFDAFLEKIFHSGGTLTIQLYLSASKGEFEVAFGIAVVLLVIVLLINFGTKRLAKKLEKH